MRTVSWCPSPATSATRARSAFTAFHLPNTAYASENEIDADDADAGEENPDGAAPAATPKKPAVRRDVLVFSDRGVYKPGETVQFKAVVREWHDGGFVNALAQHARDPARLRRTRSPLLREEGRQAHGGGFLQRDDPAAAQFARALPRGDRLRRQPARQRRRRIFCRSRQRRRRRRRSRHAGADDLPLPGARIPSQRLRGPAQPPPPTHPWARA